MKAVSVHVSLNPELAEFAKNDSRSGAFDSVGDYVRDLIRRRREEEIGGASWREGVEFWVVAGGRRQKRSGTQRTWRTSNQKNSVNRL